jgi:hypothetical protein
MSEHSELRPAAADELERRRELVRAFLAGYGQAVEDYGLYARSESPEGARTGLVGGVRWWRLRRRRGYGGGNTGAAP